MGVRGVITARELPAAGQAVPDYEECAVQGPSESNLLQAVHCFCSGDDSLLLLFLEGFLCCFLSLLYICCFDATGASICNV